MIKVKELIQLLQGLEQDLEISFEYEEHDKNGFFNWKELNFINVIEEPDNVAMRFNNKKW